jgi:hypothetical protein
MRIAFNILFAATLMVSVPAVAATGDQDATPAAEAADTTGTAAVDTTEAAAAEADGAKKSTDPMVCERIEEIGSRLRKKKVCMLKSQWQEQRRSDRDNIERSQVQRGLQPAG